MLFFFCYDVVNAKKSDELRRYSGVMGVTVLWLTVSSAMHRAGLGLVDSRPISYLGVNSKSSVLFSSGLLVSATLFIIFAFYLHNKFNAGRKFLVYFLIGQAGQIVAAVTPYGKDSPLKVMHTVAAFILAFSLPLLLRQFAISQKGTSHYRVYRMLLGFELITFIIGIGLFIFTTGIAPLGKPSRHWVFTYGL